MAGQSLVPWLGVQLWRATWGSQKVSWRTRKEEEKKRVEGEEKPWKKSVGEGRKAKWLAVLATRDALPEVTEKMLTQSGEETRTSHSLKGYLAKLQTYWQRQN